MNCTSMKNVCRFQINSAYLNVYIVYSKVLRAYHHRLNLLKRVPLNDTIL